MIKKLTLCLLLLTCLAANAFCQGKNENLKIVWPEEYKWKVISNQEDESVHVLQLIPGNESAEQWTVMGQMAAQKNFKAESVEQILNAFKQASEQESPKAKFTVLQKSSKPDSIWALFKVETPSFPNDPVPESQLYYVVQGEITLYFNFVAVKKKKLSKEFIDEWTKVFMNSELVYQ
ncbi:MAG: hypothetical protein LPJ89_10150 [Hymenobacteraceae bacterium]|nr:hypothetical protein [Hymenobacteraceae bacterium]MDX5397722.1 hypothetical protein [Hymenobacteraceae bacterium]MDX5444130.1 hypothetical protein [Hymenobacteraceae bacterium]MDX5513800.1 hypothetical protein [Hymenobacteraceae bacterium]